MKEEEKEEVQWHNLIFFSEKYLRKNVCLTTAKTFPPHTHYYYFFFLCEKLLQSILWLISLCLLYLIASMRDDWNSLLCYRNMLNVSKMFSAWFLNASQKHKWIAVGREHGMWQNIEPFIFRCSLRMRLNFFFTIKKNIK